MLLIGFLFRNFDLELYIFEYLGVILIDLPLQITQQVTQ